MSPLQHLRALLDSGDIRGALQFLNGRTPHRFTSLYLFDDAQLRNVHIVDQLNPELERTDDVPVLASYCVFVRDSGQIFGVSDSHRDARVDGHPRQPQIRAYCGVPLIDDMGRVFGTICHFDFEPLDISDDNVALMEAVAPSLSRVIRAQPLPVAAAAVSRPG